MDRLDRIVRRLIPSLAPLSYTRPFEWLNPLIDLRDRRNPAFRDLPPNHLRVRIGVGDRLFRNQEYHLNIGETFQMECRQHRYFQTDSVILEIGCGVARMIWPLRGDTFNGHYIGIDIDPEMIEWCRRNFDNRFEFHLASHANHTYRGSVTSSAYRLPVTDNSVDFLFSTSLFTHLLEPELLNYVTESPRVLKKSAKTTMTYFCRDSVAIGGRWTFPHRVGNAAVESTKSPEAASGVRIQLARSSISRCRVQDGVNIAQ